MLKELPTVLTPELQGSIAQIEAKYRDYLNSLLRYDRFRSEETPDEWVQLLGPDVLAATHPVTTLDVAQRLLAYNQEQGISLAQAEETLLYVCALVHDLGEIKIENEGVGDISFDQKTSEHEVVELSIFDRICQDLPDGESKELIRTAYYEVAQKKTGLGELFNVVERIGYLETALRAYRGVEGVRIQNWQGLTGNVFFNQIEKLIDYMQHYPFVRQVLKLRTEEIDEVFAQVTQLSEAPLDKYGEPSFDVGRLASAYQAWQQLRPTLSE